MKQRTASEIAQDEKFAELYAEYLEQHVRDYPAADAQIFVGKTVTSIINAQADEGWIITFDNGSSIEFGFSGCEGVIIIK